MHRILLLPFLLYSTLLAQSATPNTEYSPDHVYVTVNNFSSSLCRLVHVESSSLHAYTPLDSINSHLFPGGTAVILINGDSGSSLRMEYHCHDAHNSIVLETFTPHKHSTTPNTIRAQTFEVIERKHTWLNADGSTIHDIIYDIMDTQPTANQNNTLSTHTNIPLSTNITHQSSNASTTTKAESKDINTTTLTD